MNSEGILGRLRLLSHFYMLSKEINKPILSTKDSVIRPRILALEC